MSHFILSKISIKMSKIAILDKIDGKFIPPPPPPIPPNEGWENGAFWLLRAFILESLIGGGDGGLLFHFILSKIAILDKIDGKFVPPSTHIKDGKMARFGFCAASSLIFFLGGGGGGL